MAEAALKDLADRLSNSASGHAAIIGGVLNIKTVSTTRNTAALNAIYAMGHMTLRICEDEECDCYVKLLARAFPDVRIVPVSVGVRDG